MNEAAGNTISEVFWYSNEHDQTSAIAVSCQLGTDRIDVSTDDDQPCRPQLMAREEYIVRRQSEEVTDEETVQLFQRHVHPRNHKEARRGIAMLKEGLNLLKHLSDGYPHI